MQTIKTAVVVVLLLAVCYGAWVSLNSPDVDMPPSIDEWVSGEEDLDSLIGFNDEDLMSIDSAVPMTPDQFLASLEAEAEPSMSLPAEDAVALPTFPGAMSATEQPPTQPAETVSPSSTSAVGGSLPAIPQLPTDEQLSSFPALDTQLPASAVASEPQLPSALPTLPSDNSARSAVGVDATPVATTTNMMAGPASTESLVPDMDIGQPPLPAETESAMAGEAGSLATSLPTMDFAMAREQALAKAGRGELKLALEMLSPYYNSPELGYEQSRDLENILDALCKEVIYSQRHLLEPAYVVQQADTRDSVAKAFSINPELLAEINNLGESNALLAGTKLKVLRGPFRASVDLTRGELTVFLGDLYAGRFPVSFGQDPQPRTGSFEVVDRQRERTYYGSGAKVVPAGDPRNPYGGFWLNLGDHLCIHGTAEMASSDLESAGCISLAPLDARHVYGILGKESQISIVR